MADLANQPFNAKYIGYKCTQCEKAIGEEERQKIISLGCVQTWCLNCMALKYPGDNYLLRFVQSNGKQNSIIDRNKLLNS